MSKILTKLFGSVDRLKLVRLFLLNQERVFTSQEVSVRAKSRPVAVRKELNLLSGIGFIKRKKKIVIGAKKKKKVEGWTLNNSFPLFGPLKDLVLDTSPISRAALIKKISRAGRIKLIVLAGIFIQKDNSRVDILVVGDRVNKRSLEKSLKDIEAEVGKELVYTVFETGDFMYRFNIYDKFIRDILDYPHQKILDKIGI